MADLAPEKIRDVEFLPDRLNGEPVVFRGLTTSEMFLLLKLGAVLWFPVGIVICAFFGIALIGVGVGAVLTLGTIVIGGNVMQRKKRGKPDNYHVRHLKCLAQDKRLSSYGFTRYTGPWSVARTWRL